MVFYTHSLLRLLRLLTSLSLSPSVFCPLYSGYDEVTVLTEARKNIHAVYLMLTETITTGGYQIG